MNSIWISIAASFGVWLLDTIILMAGNSVGITFLGALLVQVPPYRIALRILIIGLLLLWGISKYCTVRQKIRQEYGLRVETNHATGIRVRLFQSLLKGCGKEPDEEDAHSRRLWEYASVLCDALRMEPRRMAEIRTLCWTYNIGAYAVSSPHASLMYGYEGNQDAHGKLGALMLESIPGMESAADLLRYHHECWDGSGPEGLRKNAIPLGNRIFSLVWVYDALLSHRHLKNEDALRLLYDYRETSLDPMLVDTFIKLMSKGSLKVISSKQEDAMWQC